MESGYEKLIMYVGIGLGIFPLIATIYHLAGVPLSLGLFLLPYLVLMFLAISKLFSDDWHIRKSTIYIFIAILLSLILFLVYFKGATSYPWLEDDDPWTHALAVKYINEENTAWDPALLNIHYIDPYPPFYDILLSLFLGDSVQFTLKFYNALLCGLAILFSFLFLKTFFDDNRKGLFATFILFCLPCFMSHFIWAQTLAIMLFPVAFYCLEKKWWIVSALVISGIFMAQPSSAVMFLGLGGIYCLVKGFKYIIVLITGGLLSGLYWFAMFIKYGVWGTLNQIGFDFSVVTEKASDTSGGIVYTLNDFLFAPLVSKMDQPTGVGLIVCLLVVIALIMIIFNYKKINKYILISVLWLVFSLIMVEGNLLPIKLFPHRSWVILSFPLAILSTKGLFMFMKNKYKYVILTIILVSVLWTSGYPKYVVETSRWPPGVKLSSVPNELQTFLVLGQLPKNSRVYQFANPFQNFVIGFDMDSEPWNLYDFNYNLHNTTFDEFYNYMKKNEYEYVILSPMSLTYLNYIGHNETETVNIINSFIFQLPNSTYYIPVYQSPNSVILKVN